MVPPENEQTNNNTENMMSSSVENSPENIEMELYPDDILNTPIENDEMNDHTEKSWHVCMIPRTGKS